MIKVKIKNLNELTKGYANKNSNPLLYGATGGQQIKSNDATHAYRMDINEYRKLVEKGEGNNNEPMICRKILPGTLLTLKSSRNCSFLPNQVAKLNVLFSEQNVSELSNINIDFESALASRKNAKNTYR